MNFQTEAERSVDAALVLAALKKGECPDCQGHEFLKGPSAGLAQNIKCAGCGNKFNVGLGPGVGIWYAERI